MNVNRIQYRINFILFACEKWMDRHYKKCSLYEVIYNKNKKRGNDKYGYYNNSRLMDDYHHLINCHEHIDIYKQIETRCNTE